MLLSEYSDTSAWLAEVGLSRLYGPVRSDFPPFAHDDGDILASQVKLSAQNRTRGRSSYMNIAIGPKKSDWAKP